MVTQTDVNKLIIRKNLTKAKYEELSQAGEISPNDLCFVEDDIDLEPQEGSDAYITSGVVYNALEGKVDKTSATSVVYGTDAQGYPATYAVSSFGAVDDVQVNGVSVVSNKVAVVSVPTQQDMETALATKQDVLTAGSGISISNNVISADISTVNWSDINDKPTFADVATSGDYNDLVNKPVNVSEFNNDANYVTESQLETKQDTLVSGTNIKTINNQSLLGSGNIVFDNVPTQGSTNAITSGAVYEVLGNLETALYNFNSGASK